MESAPEGMAPPAHLHPEGEGVVNSINKEDRTVNISHGPIELLDWPAMTMDIGVGEEVDLETVELNQRIKFYLGKDEAGTYVISNLIPMEEDGGHEHD